MSKRDGQQDKVFNITVKTLSPKAFKAIVLHKVGYFSVHIINNNLHMQLFSWTYSYLTKTFLLSVVSSGFCC